MSKEVWVEIKPIREAPTMGSIRCRSEQLVGLRTPSGDSVQILMREGTTDVPLDEYTHVCFNPREEAPLPEMTQSGEQHAASMRELAASLGALRKELIAQDFTEDHAVQLCDRYLTIMLSGVTQVGGIREIMEALKGFRPEA